MGAGGLSLHFPLQDMAQLLDRQMFLPSVPAKSVSTRLGEEEQVVQAVVPWDLGTSPIQALQPWRKSDTPISATSPQGKATPQLTMMEGAPQ